MLFAKLDINASPQTAQRCNIEFVPTFLIFGDGQELARMVGGGTSTMLKPFIDPFIPT
jgi:thioredoxin-like negative regulator of GroEL